MVPYAGHMNIGPAELLVMLGVAIPLAILGLLVWFMIRGRSMRGEQA